MSKPTIALKDLQKANPKYFQGTIQVRGKNEEDVFMVVDLIKEKFDESPHFISKIAEVRGGVDLLSSSNKFSRKVGKWLHCELGGELKESETLHTRDKQSGKELYRLTVLYKIPEILKGDVVAYKDQLILVTMLRKDVLNGTDLKTGKRTNFKLKREIKNSIEKLERYRDKIIATKPRIQILDPETYQAVDVVNKDSGFRVGKWVRFVIRDGSAYIVS